jgi:hypothetical protein
MEAAMRRGRPREMTETCHWALGRDGRTFCGNPARPPVWPHTHAYCPRHLAMIRKRLEERQ